MAESYVSLTKPQEIIAKIEIKNALFEKDIQAEIAQIHGYIRDSSR